MSNKLKNTARNQENQQSKRLNIQMLLEYATAAVMLAVCCFVPLYVSNGFYNIGEDKYAAFRQCMIWGMPVLCLLFIVYLIWNRKELQRPQMSATDIFVVLFLLAVCLSVVCGGFLPNALKGYPGWYMGLLSQVCFALIYLFASRFGKYRSVVLIAWCVCTIPVFLFGILNRLDYDVLGYYQSIDPVYKVTFISTLGQTSWYASYMIVILPIGIACLIFGQQKWVQLLGGIFSFVGFCSLVSVNSESAYGAFAAWMIVFFLFACMNAKYCFMYLIVCDMFVLAGRFFCNRYMHRQNPYFWPDMITKIVIFNHKLMWTLLALLIILTIITYVCMIKKWWPQQIMGYIRLGLLTICVFSIVVVVITIICNTKGMLPPGVSAALSKYNYFTWRETWGNNRGKTWTFSVQMYHNYPLINKLFGVGPDCYYDYASRHYAQRLYEMWGNQALTNAHNEWLNMLLTTGLFGTISYIGIFVSAMKRFLQKENRNWFTIAVAGSIVSYMAYNFFCYQQVLCTPFIFMLMGFGMYVVSHGKDASKTCN